MRKLAAVLAAILALGLLVAAGHGDDDRRSFKADLTGAEEAPDPVVTETSGKATFKANKDETEIRFKLKVKDADSIFFGPGAHIHCAPAGENGPVAVDLAGTYSGGLDGKVEIKATITAANIKNAACGSTIAELLDAMAAGNTYVNVHSEANPGGEVRGQIR